MCLFRPASLLFPLSVLEATENFENRELYVLGPPDSFYAGPANR
jgi:hypothetical protein